MFMGGIDQEQRARIKQFLAYSKPEKIAFVLVALFAGLIFSLRFPGESFTISRWFSFFIWSSVIAAISILIRVSWQKMVGLRRGYYVEYQILWAGVAASLLLAIVTRGYIPLLALGAVTTTFMVRQRVGEFRYGTSFKDVAMVIMWSVIIHLILAAIFAFLLYAFPSSALFEKAMLMNLMFAFVTLLPLPSLDGMQLFFGDRQMYFLGVLALLFFGSLLITQSRIGLLVGLTLGLIIGAISYLWTD